jgi:hypothetical protein
LAPTGARFAAVFQFGSETAGNTPFTLFLVARDFPEPSACFSKISDAYENLDIRIPCATLPFLFKTGNQPQSRDESLLMPASATTMDYAEYWNIGCFEDE